MNFCPNCGAQLFSAARFCAVCGCDLSSLVPADMGDVLAINSYDLAEAELAAAQAELAYLQADMTSRKYDLARQIEYEIEITLRGSDYSVVVGADGYDSDILTVKFFHPHSGFLSWMDDLGLINRTAGLANDSTFNQTLTSHGYTQIAVFINGDFKRSVAL